jgi:hypothetical protein
VWTGIAFTFVAWNWAGTFSDDVQFQYGIFPTSGGRCGVNFFRSDVFAVFTYSAPSLYCSNTEITVFQSNM